MDVLLQHIPAWFTLLNKPVDSEIIGSQLLIELLGAKFFFALILKEADNDQHQQEGAEKIKEKPAVKSHNV